VRQVNVYSTCMQYKRVHAGACIQDFVARILVPRGRDGRWSRTIYVYDGRNVSNNYMTLNAGEGSHD